MQDREAVISARAHQLWEESGRAHGQHEQHWRQAEREYDEARWGAVAQLVSEDVKIKLAETASDDGAKGFEPVVQVLVAPTKKLRASRKRSGAELCTEAVLSERLSQHASQHRSRDESAARD